MAAKPNRRLQAWWLIVPLGLIFLLAPLVQLSSDSLPSSQFGEVFELILALAFGIGAVWLLSSWLGRGHRVLAFVLTTLVLAGFSVLSLFALRSPDEDMLRACWEAIGILAVAFALSVALSVAGMLCRRHYSRMRFSLWLVLSTLAFWLLLYGGFWMFSATGGSDGLTAWDFLGAVLAATGFSLGPLLPFLVLSFANGFYHERLKQLLHTGQLATPPVIGLVEPVAATART
jgi:hypothetical protein